MFNLDDISTLFSYHVDRILYATVRDYWDHRRVSDTEIFDTMDAELGVHNALMDALR